MLPPEMKLGTSRRGTGVPALVAFMVLATVGLALAAQPGPSGTPSPTTSISSAPRAHLSHQGEIPTPSDEPSPSEDPAVACSTALATGSDALEQQRGLDRAIEVILENCGKSPQAQGLLIALGHLQANQARRDAGSHGGQPNEHANGAATDDGVTPGRTDPPTASDGSSANGQSATHMNEHASTASHP